MGVPVGFRQVYQRRRLEDAGIVDEHVDPAGLVGGVRDNLFDGRLVGDVEIVAPAFPAGGFHFRLHLGERLGFARQIADHDVRTVLGEADGEGCADTAAGAGHECGFSVQFSHCPVP